MDPEVGRALMLAGLLPAGTDRYIALYLGNPSTAAGLEITLTGYVRVAHQDWTTTIPGVGESVRSNASDIQFATITQAGAADYWAIFDAAVAGNLLRYGLITDMIGTPSPVVFSGFGDDPRFPIGALRVPQKDG
jgi:hypothetical protein